MRMARGDGARLGLREPACGGGRPLAGQRCFIDARRLDREGESEPGEEGPAVAGRRREHERPR